MKSPDSKRKLSTADVAAKPFQLQLKPEPAFIIASVHERKCGPISGRARRSDHLIFHHEFIGDGLAVGVPGGKYS